MKNKKVKKSTILRDEAEKKKNSTIKFHMKKTMTVDNFFT